MVSRAKWCVLLVWGLLLVPGVSSAFEWDDIEDAAESVGSTIEEGWEKVEDTVIPETEEERREEAQERREDAAEEAEEERQKRARKGK